MPNLNIVHGTELPPLGMPLSAGVTVKKGDGVCFLLTDGYLELCAARATSAFTFAGFAEDGVDNSGGSDGDKYVRVFPWMLKLVPTIATATGAADIGKLVYMDGAASFTLAAGSDPYNVKVGSIASYVPSEGFYVFAVNGKMANLA